MFLYIITMIEPTDKLRDDQKEGGSFMLTLGGLPGSEFADGPWNKKQREQVALAVKKWYENPPENITTEHKSIRDSILTIGNSDHYEFCAHYNHHQEGEPTPLMDDMGNFYKILKEFCTPHNMTVTQFTSI